MLSATVSATVSAPADEAPAVREGIGWGGGGGIERDGEEGMGRVEEVVVGFVVLFEVELRKEVGNGV